MRRVDPIDTRAMMTMDRLLPREAASALDLYLAWSTCLAVQWCYHYVKFMRRFRCCCCCCCQPRSGQNTCSSSHHRLFTRQPRLPLQLMQIPSRASCLGVRGPPVDPYLPLGAQNHGRPAILRAPRAPVLGASFFFISIHVHVLYYAETNLLNAHL